MTAARDDRSLAGGPLGQARTTSAHPDEDADARTGAVWYGRRPEPDGYETSSRTGRHGASDEDSAVFDIADDRRGGGRGSATPSVPGPGLPGAHRPEGGSMTYPSGRHGSPPGERPRYPGSTPAAAPPGPYTSEYSSGPFSVPTSPPPPPPSAPAAPAAPPERFDLPSPRDAPTSNDVHDTVSLIRSSFAAIEHRGDELMRLFYGWLFRLSPETRDLFPVTMELQRTRFLRGLLHVVQMVDDPDDLAVFLRQLGRDHRKFGVIRDHYDHVGDSLVGSLKEVTGPAWNDRVEEAWRSAYGMVADIMLEAAEAERGPAVWMARVMEHRRISQDLAVVRVQTSEPVPYLAGQYVSVETPQRPRMWRSMSPANAPGPDCVLEFHVRTVPGGWVSRAIVSHARVGDVWRIGPPMGQMTLDARSKSDLLMVAGGTGLAPARAIIEQLIVEGTDRKVCLFVGGRRWADLYDIEGLRRTAQENPWLTVVPVVEDDGRPHGAESGTLAEVVARYGAWADRAITISGSPPMVRTTVSALLDAGTPFLNIHYDPYHTD